MPLESPPFLAEHPAPVHPGCFLEQCHELIRHRGKSADVDERVSAAVLRSQGIEEIIVGDAPVTDREIGRGVVLLVRRGGISIRGLEECVFVIDLLMRIPFVRDVLQSLLEQDLLILAAGGIPYSSRGVQDPDG